MITKEEYHNNKHLYYRKERYNMYVKHKEIDEDFFLISKEEYSKNKELYEAKESLYVSVEDSNGNRFRILKTDPRYVSGELTRIKIKGKPLSEEHKKKLRFSKNVGENNGSYGSVWITKDNSNIRIPKELLDDYIKKGWKKGRYLGGKTQQEYIRIRDHKRYNNYMSSRYNNYTPINFGQCHVCGQYNCNDPLCKQISNTVMLCRLIDTFHFDVSKLGTLSAKEEFIRIRNEWQEMRNKMSSLKKIADYYGMLEITLYKIFERFHIIKKNN